MKTLNIIETAYRATLEEQDDPAVWIVHALRSAGADLALLLRGNAVNYVVKDQAVPPLMIGARRQKQAPHLAEAISGLIGKGVTVHVVDEDLVDRGLAGEELIADFKTIRRSELPRLIDGYDRIWHW